MLKHRRRYHVSLRNWRFHTNTTPFCSPSLTIFFTLFPWTFAGSSTIGTLGTSKTNSVTIQEKTTKEIIVTYVCCWCMALLIELFIQSIDWLSCLSNVPPFWPQLHNLKRTKNKSFTRWIELIRATRRWAVTHQNWVAWCSARAPEFQLKQYSMPNFNNG